MATKYPSSIIQNYSTKLAFLIDCAGGLNSVCLTSRFMDFFPPNSDVFLFYPNTESGMIRRFKRLEENNQGIFFFPTSANGIENNISFLLGQINHIYSDFILIVNLHEVYEDICRLLIEANDNLREHVQVRSFEREHEFEQFLKEMTRLQNENENKHVKEYHTFTMNYSRKHLFHSCPLETKFDSSNLYRFGEFLHHMDTEHGDFFYEYCAECQQTLADHDIKEQGPFEEHIRDNHWDKNGFQITIRPL